MRSLLLFVVALPLSIAAHASDWRIIMTEADGTVILVDGGTLHRQGSALMFWQKDKHRDGTMEGSRIRLDCRSRTWQLLYQQNFDSAGRMVSTLERPLRPRPIAPGSLIDREASKLCAVLVRNAKTEGIKAR